MLNVCIIKCLRLKKLYQTCRKPIYSVRVILLPTFSFSIETLKLFGAFSAQKSQW